MPDTYELPTLRCLRCGHRWIPRKPEKPRICPKCKSPYWDRERKERTMNTEHYTIDPSRLAEIVAIVQQRIPRMTESHVREYCLADWPEGQEHQAWLDNATVEEIASWVVDGNLEQFFAAPGDYHEAWCKIWDATDGEYLSGTIESVPDDRTFTVRAVPSGRLWECRHLGDGEVVEAEVIG